jgi:hypothetical protein
LASFGDLLHQLVTVHRGLPKQLQHGGSHVAARGPQAATAAVPVPLPLALPTGPAVVARPRAEAAEGWVVVVNASTAVVVELRVHRVSHDVPFIDTITIYR